MKTSNIGSVYQKKAAESTEYIHKPALATRHNEGKRRWSLLDIEAIEGLIDALEYGAEKYSRDDWKKGMPITVLYDKVQRHLAEVMKKNDIDSESGLLHVDHAMADLMFLSHMVRERKDMDDRN